MMPLCVCAHVHERALVGPSLALSGVQGVSSCSPAQWPTPMRAPHHGARPQKEQTEKRKAMIWVPVEHGIYVKQGQHHEGDETRDTAAVAAAPSVPAQSASSSSSPWPTAPAEGSGLGDPATSVVAAVAAETGETGDGEPLTTSYAPVRGLELTRVTPPGSFVRDSSPGAASRCSGATSRTFCVSQAGDSSVATGSAADWDSESDDTIGVVRNRSVRDGHDTQPKLRHVRKSRHDDGGGWPGNIGWGCYNYGTVGHCSPMGHHLKEWLKSSPAQILGVCECDRTLQACLERDGVAGDMNADKDTLERRGRFQYQTLMGDEKSSLLIGVRTTVGELELLYWKRIDHGNWNKKGKPQSSISRHLVVKISTWHPVNGIGKNHVVMCVHVHNHLANNGFNRPGKLTKYWEELSETIIKYDVRVLMGDFNMSLWQVVPQLRKRGLEIDMAGWYPWTTSDGTIMTDSVGIFMINVPGKYRLWCPMKEHGNGDGTYVVRNKKHGLDNVEITGSLDVHLGTAGPGQSLKTYLPKKTSLWEKLKPSFEPSGASARAIAEYERFGGKQRHTLAEIRDKKLQADIWRYEGNHQGGSHFPLFVLTEGTGRRSPEALRRRMRFMPHGSRPSSSRGRGGDGDDCVASKGSGWRGRDGGWEGWEHSRSRGDGGYRNSCASSDDLRWKPPDATWPQWYSPNAWWTGGAQPVQPRDPPAGDVHPWNAAQAATISIEAAVAAPKAAMAARNELRIKHWV